MTPRPSPPWPFKRETLERLAKQGGDRTCPTCGASTIMVIHAAFESNEEGCLREPFCPSCWEKPVYGSERRKPKQMAMEV